MVGTDGVTPSSLILLAGSGKPNTSSDVTGSLFFKTLEFFSVTNFYMNLRRTFSGIFAESNILQHLVNKQVYRCVEYRHGANMKLFNENNI